jgi:two-component system sensor histidine kinase KdpD
VASLLAINCERALALDRAAAAEAARRNEEFKSSLLDGLAHDLKTPLTAIRTCVTRLIDIPPRTEAVRNELLSIIDQESIRLQTSITETIELARIESHELRLEKQDIRLAALVRSALEEVRDENRSRYSMRVDEGIVLYADPALLRRAFTQVLENARKYAPPDSPVEVEAVATSDSVTLAVLDRGPGIAPDEIGRVFDKFFRGQKGKDKVEGTGMGLSIVKSIVEAHGGTVKAENRTGGGAAIVFTLPRPSAPGTDSPDPMTA